MATVFHNSVQTELTWDHPFWGQNVEIKLHWPGTFIFMVQTSKSKHTDLGPSLLGLKRQSKSYESHTFLLARVQSDELIYLLQWIEFHAVEMILVRYQKLWVGYFKVDVYFEQRFCIRIFSAFVDMQIKNICSDTRLALTLCGCSYVFWGCWFFLF